MYTVIVILILLVCLFLAVVVLIQNSKGGGLAANFSAPNQIMGVRKTTDILEKTTWTLIAGIAVLSILTAYVAKPKAVNAGSVYDGEAVENHIVNPESSTTTFDAPIEIQDLPEE
jgi:preprotein translocase subunit SecG